jgi:uncharacterized membrane protein
LVVYSGFSHYSNSHAEERSLATGLALAPIVLVGTIVSWRWGGRLPGLLFACFSMGILSRYWSLFTGNFAIVYLIQQCGFQVFAGATFGRSLLAGRVPLCTRLADQVHGPLSTEELRYTRAVTLAWVVFFAANLLVTVALYEFAPLKLWSFFTNFLYLPLVGLMFVGEYLVRRRVLRHVPRDGLMATLRVYFASPP